jgi:hypothetical protein
MRYCKYLPIAAHLATSFQNVRQVGSTYNMQACSISMHLTARQHSRSSHITCKLSANAFRPADGPGSPASSVRSP